MWVDRYGDDVDAPAFLALLWRATIASGELEPADDVSALEWFAPTSCPRIRRSRSTGSRPFSRRGGRTTSRCTEGPANRPFG